MNVGGLASRYAKAIIELELTPAERSAVERELSRFVELYAGSADLRRLLENPSFAREQRKSVLRSLSQKLGFSSTTIKVLSLLVDKDRTRLLPEIAQVLRQYENAQKGIVRAVVTAPDALAEPQKLQLKSALSKVAGSPVDLETRVDATLLGGVVVEMDGTVFDGSVRTRIEKIRESILEEIR